MRKMKDDTNKEDNLICDMCGCKKSDVKETLDPYEHDIHDREVEITVCDDCYMLIADEI